MKKFILLFVLGFSFITNAQKKTVDSLAGFDFIGAAEHAGHMKTDKEKFMFLEHAKRTYKTSKFDLHKNSLNTSHAKGPGNSTLQGPQPAGCTNIDFESGNTSGWTVSGDNQIQTTAMGNDPFGGFPKVRPGGNFSLRLNDNNIAGKTTFTAQASRVIPVSPSNNQFQLHFAFCILNFPHPGNAAALFQVQFFNAANQQLTCPTFTCYYANPPGQFFGMPSGTAQTSTVNGLNIGNQSYPVTYVPWQTVSMDLSPYNGQNITVRITCNWCIYNYDWGYCYIDADCGTNNYSPSNNPCGTLPQQLCGPIGMASYTWTPPVGPVATTSCITANTAGTYTLNCTPFTTCAAIQNYTFAVGGAPPVANFAFSPACINSAATFTSTSVGATTYTWNWGDGSPVTSGTNSIQSHTYTSGGPKPVKLIVANSAGCRDSITINVTPVPSPIAAFNFTPACVNQAANFVDNTNLNGGPGITTWDWNWNDATPNGTQQNMTHIYTNNGTQTVQLIVTNSSGCKDTVSQSLVANPAPIVDFTFNIICEGAPTNFNNTTNANGSNIASWHWDFNSDWITDNSNQSPSHIFSNSGTFNVSLMAVTDLGCRDTIQKIVNVYSKPVAQFGFTKTCLGDYTNFSDNSYVIGSNGAINNWEWDMDNNLNTVETTGQNSMTLFSSHGPKTVHLMVTTNHGCKDTAALTVYVNASPIIDFDADKKKGCEKLPVNFINNSSIPTGAITSYSWTLGDKAVSTDKNPSHIYPAGIYTISLIATSDSGCQAKKTVNDFIHSYPVPYADFFVNPQTSDVLEPLANFINTTVGNFTHFWWYFGDGSPVDTTNNYPSHMYPDVATNYMSTLIVQNEYGCSDTTQRLVVINPNYVIYVPNAFTPNGDGLNDVFNAKGHYINKFDMMIFDRWGEQIFSSNDINKGWDGTVKGKIAENSVYVWKIMVIDVQHKRHELTGHVTLIK